MSETIKFAKLSNSNYNDWKSDMQAHLGEHGLWRLVCGKEPMPTKVDLVEDWETKAIKAASKIYLALESVHVSKKPGARFNAYDDLFTISKKEDETLMNISTRVTKAMAKIKNLRPAKFTVDKLDKELKAMFFIRALPADYKHLTSVLMLLPELDKDT
ncbi:hypothetical protein D9757_015144 [Collybiopsis confluens]|uniref:DUF4219 domain-containing protein n=1 Tax=Collybiopsis confluens TaxID=2823264 RepID=A0A8H5G7M3_9AGAR|nr:hypothetical protein D9757_015144 [Collybiopsis confluens]